MCAPVVHVAGDCVRGCASCFPCVGNACHQAAMPPKDRKISLDVMRDGTVLRNVDLRQRAYFLLGKVGRLLSHLLWLAAAVVVDCRSCVTVSPGRPSAGLATPVGEGGWSCVKSCCHHLHDPPHHHPATHLRVCCCVSTTNRRRRRRHPAFVVSCALLLPVPWQVPKAADIVMEHASISRIHAAIVHSADGTTKLIDLKCVWTAPLRGTAVVLSPLSGA